jgi:hypothetical protein
LSVVSVVCCQVEGLRDGLITRPEEFYRLWRVVVCDQETSKNKEEAKARYRAVKIQPHWVVTPGKQTNFIHNSDIITGLGITNPVTVRSFISTLVSHMGYLITNLICTVLHIVFRIFVMVA